MKHLLIISIVVGMSLEACNYLSSDRSLNHNDPKNEGSEQTEQETQQHLQHMRSDIIERIGQARCKNIEDCRFTGLGAKPCGGPWEYLVYSSVETNADTLITQVRRYNQVEHSINKRFGRVSDCSIPAEPKLECVAHCIDANQPVSPTPVPLNMINMEIIDSFSLINTPDDPFNINNGTINGQALHLSVSYGGGCADHKFNLWATSKLGVPDNEPIKNIILTHNSNGDVCKAFITTEIILNLEPLVYLHPDAKILLISVNDFDERFEFVLPRPIDQTFEQN